MSSLLTEQTFKQRRQLVRPASKRFQKSLTFYFPLLDSPEMAHIVSLGQYFFEKLQGPLVTGLAEPENRLLAHGGLGMGFGDFD